LRNPRPKPPKPFIPSFEELRLKNRAKDLEIERRLRGPKSTTLPDEQEAEVDALFTKHGIISKFQREQVTDKDIRRLKPQQWLNDEIINFYGQLIMSRSEASKENPAVNGAGKNKLLNVHYFNTFFWQKLKDEGYEKGRLAKWTKKVSCNRHELLV
jgi:sentrin-specific protease 1